MYRIEFMDSSALRDCTTESYPTAVTLFMGLSSLYKFVRVYDETDMFDAEARVRGYPIVFEYNNQA